MEFGNCTVNLVNGNSPQNKQCLNLAIVGIRKTHPLLLLHIKHSSCSVLIVLGRRLHAYALFNILRKTDINNSSFFK